MIAPCALGLPGPHSKLVIMDSAMHMTTAEVESAQAYARQLGIDLAQTSETEALAAAHSDPTFCVYGSLQ